MLSLVLGFILQYLKSANEDKKGFSNEDFENPDNFRKLYLQVLEDHPEHLKRLEDILLEAEANELI